MVWNEYYPRKELNEIGALISQYTNDVVMGKRGAQRALQKLTSERRESTEIGNDVGPCERTFRSPSFPVL